MPKKVEDYKLKRDAWINGDTPITVSCNKVLFVLREGWPPDNWKTIKVLDLDEQKISKSFQLFDPQSALPDTAEAPY